MVCCDNCGEYFSRTDSLIRHRRRKHPCQSIHAREVNQHKYDHIKNIPQMYANEFGDTSKGKWSVPLEGIRNQPIENISISESTDQCDQQRGSKLRVDNGICNYSWGDESSEEDQPEGAIYNAESMSRNTESSIYDITNYSWNNDGAVEKTGQFSFFFLGFSFIIGIICSKWRL